MPKNSTSLFQKLSNDLLMVLTLCISITVPCIAQATSSASTLPVGFVTVNITAGTGSAKKTSLVSIPLLTRDSTIPSRGIITLVKDNKTIEFNTTNLSEDGNTTIPPGYLSNPAEPFLLSFTSGDAEGYMLLVAHTPTNTNNILTLSDPHDPSLNITSMGVKSGDTFSLHPCDTLLSFFGTPETTYIKGGTASGNADSITLVYGGSSSTYFYSTSLNRWARVSLGTPNANNTPLLPYYGIQYGRLEASPLRLISVGEVPIGKRKVKIRANGATILASYWSKDTHLGNSAIKDILGWRSGSTISSSDKITTVLGGSASTFWHDGLNWKRVSFGSPIANTNNLPIAGAVLINKTTQNSITTVLEDQAPYNF